MPVLVVAGVELRLARILVRDVALFPGREARLDRLWIGAGPQLHIDMAVLAAPAGEHVGRVEIIAGIVEPGDAGGLAMRVLRQILQDAGVAEVAGRTTERSVGREYVGGGEVWGGR